MIGGFHFRSKHDSFKLPPLRMSQSIGCNARFADASVVVAILKIGHRGQRKVWPIESQVNDLVQNATFPPEHDDCVLWFISSMSESGLCIGQFPS